MDVNEKNLTYKVMGINSFFNDTPYNLRAICRKTNPLSCVSFLKIYLPEQVGYCCRENRSDSCNHANDNHEAIIYKCSKESVDELGFNVVYDNYHIIKQIPKEAIDFITKNHPLNTDKILKNKKKVVKKIAKHSLQSINGYGMSGSYEKNFQMLDISDNLEEYLNSNTDEDYTIGFVLTKEDFKNFIIIKMFVSSMLFFAILFSLLFLR